MSTFTGWIVRKDGDGATASLEQLDTALLDQQAERPDQADGGVRVRVLYSSINYKDALALQGRPGVVRTHPLVPGIDVVGEVTASSDPRWHPGQLVVANGGGLGEERHGALAELAVVDPDICLAVPDVFTPGQAAAIGTAGFTAALGVLALQDAGVTPEAGTVLVTGAGGGVGSVAVALLSSCGHRVAALTGRVDELTERLTALGADEVVDRAELAGEGRPLASQRWAAVADAVGGRVLANALAQLQQSGVATACGNAGGVELPTTVMPFILRGVRLLGIDSVRVSAHERQRAWDLLAEHLDPSLLDEVTRHVPLDQAQRVAAELLDGRGTGRTVVDVTAP